MFNYLSHHWFFSNSTLWFLAQNDNPFKGEMVDKAAANFCFLYVITFVRRLITLFTMWTLRLSIDLSMALWAIFSLLVEYRCPLVFSLGWLVFLDFIVYNLVSWRPSLQTLSVLLSQLFESVFLICFVVWGRRIRITFQSVLGLFDFLNPTCLACW